MNDFSEFKIDAKKDSPQDKYLQAITPTEDSGIFRAYLAIVKKLATIAGVIGVIAGICFSVLAFFSRDDFKTRELRGLFMMPVISGLITSGMVLGTALLFASSRFFLTAEGIMYLGMIGTRNVLCARIVILIFLIIGAVLATVFVWAGLDLAGFITPQ